MSIHQHATLADTVYFWFAANDTSGSGADGATPVYDVRLAGAAAGAIPVLSGSATLLSHANYPAGCHEVAVAATAGNGFAATNTYAVFCTLLVDSQNPTGFVGSFTLDPIIANVKEVDDDSTAAANLKTLYDGVEGFAPAYAGPRGPGVYLNDAAANTSTVNGVDGTRANPVSTIAASKTIADSLGVDRIYLVNDSSVTLAATMEDYELVGIGEMSVNSVNLGTQDVDNSVFYNLLLTGAQGGTSRCQAVGCALSSITGMEITALGCLIADGGSLTLRNDCAFDSCFSAVAGSGTPTLDINSVANVNVYFRHYSGGLQIDNAVATTVMSYESDGQLVVDATCTSLTIVVRGNCSITDNGTTTSLTQDAAINRTAIEALIGPNVHGANCYYVDEDQADDTGNGLTWSAAKKTIGAAVGVASSGDTIIVGKGSYVETATITIAAGESLRIIGAGDSITSLDNDTASATFNVLGVLEIRGMFVDSGVDIAINLSHANARLRGYDCRFECTSDVGIHVNVSGAVAMCYRCYADGLYDTFIVDAGGRLLFADGIIIGSAEGVLSSGETLVTDTLLDCSGNDLQRLAGNLHATGCGYTTTSGTILDDDADILADTGELQTNQGNWLTATGFSTSSDVTTAHSTTDGLITTVDTVADGIQTDLSNATDGLGALKTLIDAIPTTAMRGTDSASTHDAAAVKTAIEAGGSSIALIKAVTDAFTAAAAAKLALSAAGIVTGAAAAGTLSTTQMTTDLSEATDDHYIGAVVVWTSGVLSGQRSDITDSAGASGLLTFTEVTEAASAGDTFVIL